MKKTLLFINFFLILVFNVYPQWEHLSSPNGGSISTLYSDIYSNVYAGTKDGGIYISTDQGNSWSIMKNSLNQHTVDQKPLSQSPITSIVESGSNIVAGTYNGVLTFNKNNGTWNKSEDFFCKVNSLVTRGGIVYAGTNIGIYQSLDSGNSWTLFALGNKSITSLAVNENKIIAGGTFGFYISTNYGQTWESRSSGLPDYINTVVFYQNLILVGSENNGIYSTNDDGSSWIEANIGLDNQSRKIKSLSVINNKIYATTSNGLYVSQNIDISWDFLGFEYNTINSIITLPGKLFIGTENYGVYLSTDNGNNWVDKNDGLSNKTIYSLLVCDNTIYSGTNGGVFISSDNGKSGTIKKVHTYGWNKIFSLAKDGNNLWAGTEYGIYLSVDNGENWTSKGLFGNEIYSITKNNNDIFVGTEEGLYLSSDNGENWIFKGLFLSKIYSIIIEGNTIFIGGNNGFYRSNDYGNNWTPYNGPYTIKSLAKKENNIYAGSFGLFASTNIGETWTKKYFANAVNSISILKDTVFIGGNFGVLSYSTDNADSWKDLADLYLKDHITITTIHDSYLYLGTQASGLWRIKLSDIERRLNVLQSTLNIGATQNTSTSINIVSNVNWTATCDQKWITLDSKSGIGDAKLTIYATGNYSESPRVATITISGDGVTSKKVTIIQGTNSPITLSVAPVSLNVESANNSSSDFYVFATIPWSINCDQNWISFNKSQGTTDEKITLTVLENPSSKPRTATITISGVGTSSKTVTVTQAGSAPMLNVNPEIIDLSTSSKSTTLFTITSNTTWEIYTSSNWLTFNNSIGENNETITLTASENLSSSPRTGYIIITGSDLDSKYIKITQPVKVPTLNVTPTSLTIKAGQYNQTSFELKSNVKWTISRDQNWLSVSNIEGENNSLVNVWATANENTEPRTATITISGEGVETKYITVTQKAKVISPVLIASPNSIYLDQNGWNFNSNTINISSNTDWSASSDQSWISFNNPVGENNGSFNVFATPNDDPNPRYANIFISADNAFQIINVTQSGTEFTPFLSTYPSYFVFNAEANSNSFEINSNVSWSVNCNQPWIKTSISYGSYNNATISFTTTANETNSLRTCTITVYGDGTQASYINITQAGANTTLDVNPASLNLAAVNGSTNFNVESNTFWTISKDEEWLWVSKSEGTNNETVRIFSTENNSTSPRTATITINGTGIVAKTITVTQEGGLPVISINPDIINLASINSTSNFQIKSNTSWLISTDQNWLTFNSTSGSNDASITLTATANESNTLRTATITVYGPGDQLKFISITQAGTNTTLNIDQTALDVAAKNGSTNFNITSNTTWKIISNQNWLNVNTNNGSNNANITVTANENASINPRTATITVTGTGVAAKTITVTQVGTTPTLTVDQTALSMAAAMGSTNFSITSNTGWTISSDQNWLSLSSDNGANNATITVTANENTSINTRTATITVTGTGVAAKTITVTQVGTTPTLTVDQTALSMAAAMGSTNFSITSNTVWTISSDQNWLSLSSDNGANNATITVNANENTSINSRTATITVTGTGVASKTITVNQAGATPTLTVDQTAVSMVAAMGSTNFSIASNTAWSISTDQNWLSLSSDNGANNATITVTANENTSINSRTATITVIGTGITAKTITVNQAGATPTLTVDQTALSMAAAMGSTNFSIASNTAWSISTDQNWLSLSSDNGANNATITVTANENASINPRTATITVTGTGVAAKTISITQAGATPTLTVDQTALSMAAAMGSTNFSIASNTAWTISIDQDWLSLSSDNGANNATITVNANENASINPRTATITVAGTGVAAKTITVNQAGATPTLTVDQTALSMDAEMGSTNFSIVSNIGWTISCDQSWINLSSTNGTNNGTITVSASENLHVSPRTATITVAGTGVTAKNITVNQSGAVPTLTVNPANIGIDAIANSSAYFEITSNIDWVINCSADWINIDKHSGSNNSTISIATLENISINPRTTKIQIIGNGTINRSIDVTQNGAPLKITVNPNSLNLNSAESSTSDFEINSNGDWALFSNQNWLKLNKTSGTGNSSITVTASANTNTSSRNAIVTVRGNNGVVEYVNVTQEPASPTLSVSSNNISVAASNGSTGSFKIYSNSNWVIESNSNWITLDKTAGFGYTQIGITVLQNPLGNIRSGQLTIKCNGLNDLVVNVNQSAAFINVSPIQITLNASQVSSTFNIMSNVGWTIEENQDWINLDRLQGSGSGTINLQATENTSTAKRKASITIKCSNNYYRTINLIQKGITATLEVYPNNLNFEFRETSSSFNIESNTHWKIKCDSPWLKITPTEGNGNSNINVTCTQNNSNNSRTTNITIVGDEINSNSTISVIQNALPHLIASPQSLELSSNEGSNFTLLISSNLNWTATVNQSWLTLSKSSGFGNSSILLTANANNDKSERIAILTLSADGINSQSVTIKQNTLSTGVESTNGDIIQIYPNPFNDKINVVIPEVALSSTILNVYSSYGVPVYSAKLIERNTEITLYDLKPGIYIAKITYADKIFSKVLIKI